MQVQNIECQIARAQLGRYIAGEGMAGEAISQLEAHINKCPECKAVLEQKRSSLVATLEGAKESHPAPSAPRSTADPRSSASRLAQAIIAKTAAENATSETPVQTQVAAVTVSEPQKPAVNWKPIAYAGALAAVLIAMSYLGKADLLGGKASAALPEKPEVSAAPTKTAPANKTTASPAAAIPSPAPTAKPVAPAVGTPKPTNAAPATQNPQPTTGGAPHAPTTHSPQPTPHRPTTHRKPQNRIRIYDESGNAIN